MLYKPINLQNSPGKDGGSTPGVLGGAGQPREGTWLPPGTQLWSSISKALSLCPAPGTGRSKNATCHGASPAVTAQEFKRLGRSSPADGHWWVRDALEKRLQASLGLLLQPWLVSGRGRDPFQHSHPSKGHIAESQRSSFLWGIAFPTGRWMGSHPPCVLAQTRLWQGDQLILVCLILSRF